MSKAVFGLSNKARLKPVSSETSKKIEISLEATLDDTFQRANNKGTDQSAQTPKTGFLASRPKCMILINDYSLNRDDIPRLMFMLSTQ